MPPSPPAPISPVARPSWPRFSLRTLLFAMLLLGLACGLLTERVRRQRDAVSRIVGYGGQVTYDYQLDSAGEPWRDAYGNCLHELQPPGPKWLREFLGDDYFRTPVKVWLESDEGVGFIDVELERIAGPLQSLPSLKYITLRGSPITDAGLAHLRDLSQLKELDCRGTNVSEHGIQLLQEQLPHCQILR